MIALATNSAASASSSEARVRDLLETYSRPDACAATILCDRHSADSLAYRIVADDLATQDVAYRELRADSEKFAAALAAIGIGPGDRVATLMGKSREYLVTLMGIWRLGAVHVPLFTAFAPPAIALRLEGSGARAIVCDQTQRAKLRPGDSMTSDVPLQIITTGTVSAGDLSFAELVAGQQVGFPAAAVGGDGPIIHVYTSGTTGNPKGVIVSLKALASFHTYAEFGQGITSEDIFWCAADPGWAYGLYFGILSSLLTGVRSILMRGSFSPDGTLALLERENVSNFAAAPTVYRAMRSTAQPASINLPNLRRLSSAGEPLTPEVNVWAQEAFGLQVHDHYGQTEAGMLINNHHNPAVARPIREGSMGHPMPGWKGVILEAGRDEEAAVGTFGRVAFAVADSPLLWFHGYDGDPKKTAEKFSADGRYYLTGDTGTQDAEGYFHFSARDDDVIIMAGYRIGPFEVESCIASHPMVSETAVIAVPDEVRGEVIECFIVPSSAAIPSPELGRDIQQWVKTRYAAHAYPRAVHFIDAMPKTPSGKIQRYVLKQKRLAQIEAEAKV
ncbi:MAG: AMP-binding protein [Novosphingobium sp.]